MTTMNTRVLARRVIRRLRYNLTLLDRLTGELGGQVPAEVGEALKVLTGWAKTLAPSPNHRWQRQ
jgi:hypothetical protein